jgi:hypothetical protein
MSAGDDFEYADIPALEAAGWALVDSMGGVGVPSMSGVETHDGAKALRIAVTGTTGSAEDCYYERTFTGLLEYTRYTASLWVWENHESQGSVGIGCGLQIDGGSAQYVEQSGSVGFWQQFTVTGTTDGAGELTVRVGFFESKPGATYSRVGYFDGLEILPAHPWQDVLLDAGALTVDGALVGFTQGGGFDFKITRKLVQYEVEGIPADVVGLDRIIKIGAEMSGTLIEANDRVLTTLEPGVTSDEDAAEITTTYTPMATITTLTDGQYLANVRCSWRKLGGGFLRVTFPRAICTGYSVTGKDKAEGQIKLTIEARLASGAVVSDAPYSLELIAPST